MINKIILLATLLLGSTLVSAQPDFSDLKFDSTQVFKNEEKKIHRIDYFLKDNLTMQKFYPNDESIGGFCYGTNLVYDSVLVHLGPQNFVANFSIGGKSVTVYSWSTNSNIVNINTYNESGDQTTSIQTVKIPSAESPYPLCWYYEYNVGMEKTLHEGKLKVRANHEEGFMYTNSYKDKLTIHPAFLKLKKKAILLLENSYETKFISKNIVFNPSKSCYYSETRGDYYDSGVEPRHNSGIQLFGYNEAVDKIKYVDLAFDIQIDEYRFNCISLRLDNEGNIINKQVKLWNSTKNSSIGLNKEKVTQIISPKDAQQIAKKHSKWPITGNTSVYLAWMPESGRDPVGTLVYQVNYDFIKRGWAAAYARQVIIKATDGTFVEETEISSLLETAVSSNKITENGKWGFNEWGEIVIPAEYDELPDYYSSFMIAKKDGKYGVINGKNEVLVDFIYDKIEFHKSPLERYNFWYLVLTKDGYQGLYEIQKGMILEAQYQSFSETKDEQIIAISTTGKQVIFDFRTGEVR